MSRQFHRPIDYDPDLAEQAANGKPHVSREEALKNDLGFESDSNSDINSDLDIDDDSNNRRKVAPAKKKTEQTDASLTEEIERLTDCLQEANDARQNAEEQAARAEERIEELQRMSKQAKQILVTKFRQQLKVLMAQVEEQKVMLAEDDDTLEALRLANTKLEYGDTIGAQEIQQKMKEFRDSRVLTRENTSLRYKIEEMVTTLRSTKEELVEAKKEAEEAQAKIRAADGDDIPSLKAKVDKLETERSMFRDEIKKRHVERMKLMAQLNVLQEKIGENGSNGITNAAISSEERELLLSKIATLESALSNRPTTSGPSDREKLLEIEKQELQHMMKKMDELMKKREEEMKEVKEKAKDKLTTASNAIKKLKTEYANLRTAYNKQKSEGSGMDSATAASLRSSIRSRKIVLSNCQNIIQSSKGLLNGIKAELDSFSKMIPTMGPAIGQAVTVFLKSRRAEQEELLVAYRKEMALRKQLFNQVQELKGNIRVYCRIRPMAEREKMDAENNGVITYPDENEMVIANVEKKTNHNFEFEKIFNPSSTQDEVFAEVSDLVISAMDGYNVCIFAYGQTGSGKTFTMQGPPENPGVNVRALAKLFETATERHASIKYEIKITLLEIYNEKIQDLLGEKGRILQAKQGTYGMEVPDLTMVPVSTKEEVLDTLKRGSKNRHVTSTNMNDASSRSHLILSVYVMGRNTVTGKDVMGKLHLIDLAGSERVGRSGVTGDALKEAQNINSSLSALGNVISARANKQAHVPYRDSTLTYLLQDSLSNNSKTLMFVQVSPARNDTGESICSLRFAERVRKVELGKAVVNKKKGGDN